jgi:hypothetical protein
LPPFAAKPETDTVAPGSIPIDYISRLVAAVLVTAAGPVVLVVSLADTSPTTVAANLAENQSQAP